MKKELSLILMIFVLSCQAQNIERTNKVKLQLYERSSGANNNVICYGDVVVLEPYKNNQFTIFQLSKIARAYVDTVKADHIVNDVTFIGKRDNIILPDPEHSNLADEAKFYVASFGFDNGSPKYAGNKNPDLTDITVWRNGEPNEYYFTSKKNKGYSFYKKTVDSLLNDTTPINTGYK